VPLMLTFGDAQKSDIARASQGEVFAQILKDLTEAEPALTARTDGRATRGAAQMALADTYLWRSSFMLTNEWQQASDWAKKVIDSGTYALNNGYFSTFLASNKGAGNREMIFRVVALAQTGATTAFSSSYYPRVLGFGSGTDRGGFGAVQPTAWFLSSFAKGDIRGTVGPERGTTAADYAADTVAFRTRGCVPAACRDFAPHVWKFRVVDRLLNDIDVPLYRYAETLLFYAEAQNELGNSAEAIRNVNLVRARARRGMGSDSRVEPADLSPAMSRAEARDAVYMERAWELGFEGGQRWFDLVRRDSLDPGFWKNSLQNNDPNSFARGAITEFKKRFPIPDSEINVMPTLTQNPGF
jgi:starch-binding outer membrane protein, SusD/RagB family